MKGELLFVTFLIDKFSSTCNALRMKYQTDKGSHSVYTLQFHYVCTVKYRRKVLENKVAQRLFQINKAVAQGFGVRILEQNTDVDHVHILFSSKPQVQLSFGINRRGNP